MTIGTLHGANPSTGQAEAEAFYRALTVRNQGLVDDREQHLLRNSPILVAGCGSIGGGAVEPLVRLGAETLRLAEPDVYELHNLNRQNAVRHDVGTNKAAALAERCGQINPYATIEVESRGVTPQSIEALLAGAALVIDGVDVTTTLALEAKYLLHVRAHARGVPVISGYDIAGVQVVLVYDYRNPRIDVLGGRFSTASPAAIRPLSFLASVVPLRAVPIEIIPTLRRLAAGEELSFPQLGYTAQAFGVLAARISLEMLAGRRVRHCTLVDVHQLPRPFVARCSARARAGIAVVGLARVARSQRDAS